MDPFQRVKTLINDDGLTTLQNKKIAIIGVGGVGSYVAEALARAPIGNITLIDFDIIDITNINRQLPALHSTIGKSKVEVLAERIKDINPKCKITIKQEKLTANSAKVLIDDDWDYIIDAIDDVPAKVFLLKYCHEKQIPIISSMGAAGKLDPSQVKVTDISKSNHCPLARKVRKQLHNYNIYKGIKVVFSPESKPSTLEGNALGTISYMPAIFGLFCAATVVNDLLESK